MTQPQIRIRLARKMTSSNKSSAFISIAYDLTEQQRDSLERDMKNKCEAMFSDGKNSIGLEQYEYLDAAKTLFQNIGYAAVTLSKSKNEALAQMQLKATIDGNGVDEFVASYAKKIQKEGI